jgi:hypothetical protein
MLRPYGQATCSQCAADLTVPRRVCNLFPVAVVVLNVNRKRRVWS